MGGILYPASAPTPYGPSRPFSALPLAYEFLYAVGGGCEAGEVGGGEASSSPNLESSFWSMTRLLATLLWQELHP